MDVSGNPPSPQETLREKNGTPKHPSTKSIPDTELPGSGGSPVSSSGSPNRLPKSRPSLTQDTKSNVKISYVPSKPTQENPKAPTFTPAAHFSKTTPSMTESSPKSTTSQTDYSSIPVSQPTKLSSNDTSTPNITVSPDPDPSTVLTVAPVAGSGKLPQQRSFLAAAKRVIMQEKIKKAEQQAKDEEFGEF